jgi:hypothetical protein
MTPRWSSYSRSLAHPGHPPAASRLQYLSARCVAPHASWSMIQSSTSIPDAPPDPRTDFWRLSFFDLGATFYTSRLCLLDTLTNTQVSCCGNESFSA